MVHRSNAQGASSSGRGLSLRHGVFAVFFLGLLFFVRIGFMLATSDDARAFPDELAEAGQLDSFPRVGDIELVADGKHEAKVEFRRSATDQSDSSFNLRPDHVATNVDVHLGSPWERKVRCMDDLKRFDKNGKERDGVHLRLDNGNHAWFPVVHDSSACYAADACRPDFEQSRLEGDEVYCLPFFIGVTPAKSGSTILNFALDKHPWVSSGMRERPAGQPGSALTPELWFFDRDREVEQGLLHYLMSYFREDKKNLCDGHSPCFHWIEKTPQYFLSPLAALRMKAIFPNMRTVSLVRDPYERTINTYAHANRLVYAKDKEVNAEAARDKWQNHFDQQIQKSITSFTHFETCRHRRLGLIDPSSELDYEKAVLTGESDAIVAAMSNMETTDDILLSACANEYQRFRDQSGLRNYAQHPLEQFRVWKKVFGNQILLIRSDDYFSRPFKTVERVFSHIGLDIEVGKDHTRRILLNAFKLDPKLSWEVAREKVLPLRASVQHEFIDDIVRGRPFAEALFEHFRRPTERLFEFVPSMFDD